MGGYSAVPATLAMLALESAFPIEVVDTIERAGVGA
jgi:hypothetical protein